MPIQSIFPVRSLAPSYEPDGPVYASRSDSLLLDSYIHFNHDVMNPFRYRTPSMIVYSDALFLTFLASSWLSGRLSCCKYSTIGFIQVRCVGVKVCTWRSSILLSLSTSTKTFLDKWQKLVDSSLLRASSILPSWNFLSGEALDRFDEFLNDLYVLLHSLVLCFKFPIYLISHQPRIFQGCHCVCTHLSC